MPPILLYMVALRQFFGRCGMQVDREDGGCIPAVFCALTQNEAQLHALPIVSSLWSTSVEADATG